jgi:hypothetical protein
VTELIDDPAARARWGAAARDSVARAQDGAQWVEMVEDVYRQAVVLGPLDPAELDEPSEELTGHDTIVHRIHGFTGKQVPLADAERAADWLELAAGSQALRLAFGSLVGRLGGPEQRLRYPVALAAPVADEEMVVAIVEEFRRLARADLVERFAMAVRPASVDAVVPLIEEALAAGADVDIDLIVHEQPRSANDPGSLLVTVDGDGFGDLPLGDYPHQHRAA